MIHPPKKAEQVGRAPDTNMLPPNFDPAYIEGAVKPFFLSAKYEGEPPLLHTVTSNVKVRKCIVIFHIVYNEGFD